VSKSNKQIIEEVRKMRLSKQMIEILKCLYDQHIENVKNKRGFERNGEFLAYGVAQWELTRRIFHLGEEKEIEWYGSKRKVWYKTGPISASMRASVSRALWNLSRNGYVIQWSILGMCKEWKITMMGINVLQKRLNVNYCADVGEVHTYEKNEPHKEKTAAEREEESKKLVEDMKKILSGK
jgi:hypothetical protein